LRKQNLSILDLLKVQKLRFAKGSETLNEIIKVQRSPLINIGLRYIEEASQSQNPSTSTKSYLDAAKTNEQYDNRQQRHKVDHQVNHTQFAPRMNINRSHNQPQENHTQFAPKMNINRNYNQQVNRFDSRKNLFNGKCFSCHNFGHKVFQCISHKTIMIREAQNQRNVTGIERSSYNNFYPLEN